LFSIINPAKAINELGWRPRHVGFVEEIGTYYKAWAAHKAAQDTKIENAAEIIPRKLSFMNITNENRSRSASIVDNFAVDFHTSISSVIPIIINETDENDKDVSLFSNRKIYKNLVIISLTFVLMFTAYGDIIVLQSSLNTKGNVGVNSLIIINTFILVSIYLIIFDTKETILFIIYSLVQFFLLVFQWIFSDLNGL